MNKIITTPHDRFTKAALSERRVARAFFETHLPKNILQQIDLNTLELTQQSFVDKKLKMVITDMLFKVQWGQRLGYLYLLIEAQSQAERLMPLRSLKYQIEALEHHVKITGDKTLPVIYCMVMVLYNGKRPYHEPTDIFELFGEQQELARATFLQPFQLIDLTQISDEEIRQTLWLSILEGCLKHVWDRDLLPFFKGMTAALQQAENEGGQSLVQSALTYLMAAGNVSNPQAFVETVEQDLSKETQETVMPTVVEYLKQRAIQQVMEQGVQEGLQKGMQQGKYSLLLRLLERKFTTVPPDYREKLAQANADLLLVWGERVLEAKTLDEIFE